MQLMECAMFTSLTSSYLKSVELNWTVELETSNKMPPPPISQKSLKVSVTQSNVF